MVTAPPFVSVVIPVYNDRERLARCVDALGRQSYPVEAFEIIVVDNGSTDGLADAAADWPRVRLVRERRPGAYAARNAGAAAARGEVIAFTDSDCIPAARWIDAAVRALAAHDGLGAVAGRVDVYARDPDRPTAVELYERAVAFRQDRNVARGRFGVTANLVVRREAFAAAGAFDEALLSGGDREWCRRLVGAGYDIAYAPDAVVAHPARRTVAELARKMRRIAGGHHLLARRRPRLGRAAEIGRLLAPPVRLIGEILGSGELDGMDQKLRAAAVAVYAKYTWSWHRARYAWRGSRSDLPRA